MNFAKSWLVIIVFYAAFLAVSCSSSGGDPEPTIPPAPGNVQLTLSLEDVGIRVAWDWALSQQQTLSLFREAVGSGGGEVEVFSNTQALVTSFQDELSNHGTYRYTVDVLDGNNDVVATGEATMYFPNREVVATNLQTVAQPIRFPTVFDANGDGFIEVLGSENIDGQLIPISPADQGLEAMFAQGRVWRDQRAADFDGDGDWDVLCNGYANVHDAQTRAMLFLNDGTGFFEEDATFAAMDMRGFGETILVFDMDNDGDLDVFLPYYTHNDPSEQNYLLENLGNGKFQDIALTAGVAMIDHPAGLKVEGAHAADVNDDGWIDFIVGNRYFINTGQKRFEEVVAITGLPARFDEGLSFLDFNADGHLDIVTHHPQQGPHLYVRVDETHQNGLPVPVYAFEDAFPSDISYFNSYGLKVGDFNNDGLPDIDLASGPSGDSVFLVNFRTHYQRHPLLTNAWVGASAFADFDGDGRMDIVRRWGDRVALQTNTTDIEANRLIRVRVLGHNGAFNQQGRPVRLTTGLNPNFIVTQVVESGSGFLSQSQYDLYLGTLYPGEHELTITFATGQASFEVNPGDAIRVFADGQIQPIEPSL